MVFSKHILGLGCGLLVVAGLSAACGTSSSTSGSTSGGPQTPPQGAANVQAWLATGAYKSWKCEPSIHAARSPSPHGFNRICSNDLISTDATATGPWPMGAAAVKEMYNTATDTTPMGYAVYLKTAADSAAGSAWYWYEMFPPNTPQSVVPNVNGIVADGLGSSGPANTICVSCHVAVGMDAAHTPSPNGHDFVYTPVH
jgi:hypothetical protein